MTREMIHKRETCRCCGSDNLALSLPLEPVPIVSPNVGGTNTDLTETVASLDTNLCLDCGMIQLAYVVDPSLLYENFLYRTAGSKGLAEHFQELCDLSVERFGLGAGSFVVELGSNDGTVLAQYQAQGAKVLGVDPARAIAEEASARGIPTIAAFFDEALARDIVAEHGKADLVIANNTLANIDDLQPVFRGIEILLAEGGVCVVETQYALDVFEKTLIDVIYHEHVSCFAVQPVRDALAQYGLELFDAERISPKGGSVRFWIQRADAARPVSANVERLVALETETGLFDVDYHRRLGERLVDIKNRIHDEIAAARAAGGRVAVYGTSVGCAALIHQFDLADKIDFFLDDSPFKDRLSGPGYDLPVYTGDAVYTERPSLIIVLAWRYAHLIMPKHREYLDGGGRFLVPLPDVSIIDELPD